MRSLLQMAKAYKRGRADRGWRFDLKTGGPPPQQLVFCVSGILKFAQGTTETSRNDQMNKMLELKITTNPQPPAVIFFCQRLGCF
jgi:hypothetical protein